MEQRFKKQSLNLALHLELLRSQTRVCNDRGIAGFFDDEVNQVLGIPEDEAVLYITTIGRARRE